MRVFGLVTKPKLKCLLKSEIIIKESRHKQNWKHLMFELLKAHFHLKSKTILVLKCTFY